MKRITDFIKRNLPIFIIGLVTMLVFVGIIIVSENNDPTEPALKIVNEDELIAEHNYFKGPEDAQVVLVEFSDYECPACGLFQPVINGLEFKYPKLKIVYKHFPLPQHPNAKDAAIAAMAAGEQDAFWEYSDKLFENQNNLAKDQYEVYAKELGLNVEKFKEDMNKERIEQYVEADIKNGRSINVNSTPTFFLNGRQLNLQDITDLETAIQEEFAKLNISVEPVSTEDQQTEEELREQSRRATAIEFGDKLDKPTYDIKILADSFSPAEAEVRVGQTLVWTNETDEQITLQPRVGYEEVYPNVKNGIVIPAKGKAELKITKDDRWIYMNKANGRFGYVYAYNIDEPIVNTTQESTATN